MRNCSRVGDYSGVIPNCDRAKMYLDGKRLQWCWAHLKRDIQNLIDSPGNQVKRCEVAMLNEMAKAHRMAETASLASSRNSVDADSSLDKEFNSSTAFSAAGPSDPRMEAASA